MLCRPSHVPIRHGKRYFPAVARALDVKKHAVLNADPEAILHRPSVVAHIGLATPAQLGLLDGFIIVHGLIDPGGKGSWVRVLTSVSNELSVSIKNPRIKQPTRGRERTDFANINSLVYDSAPVKSRHVLARGLTRF